MAKIPEKAKSKSSDFFLEQASAKLKLQYDWANDLDTKASILIGFAGLILTTAAQNAPACLYLRITVILALVVAIGSGLMAYRLASYEMPPNIIQLWTNTMVMRRLRSKRS